MKAWGKNELSRMKPGTRAAIYNRVSTEKLTQLEAIGHQVEESKELVLNSPLILTEQYVETESGTTVKGREEYKRMLKDMALNRFDVLVVKSQDRMMRNQTEWHLLKNAVRRYHKEIYFYMEDELYNPRENGLKHDVQAMLDEYESEKKSEKAAHSHERRQRDYEGQECLNITRPMFGWDRNAVLDERGHKKVSFTVNQREAEAIKEVCGYLEEGKGFYAIAKIMYGKNVLSKPTFGTNPQPPKRIDGNTWKRIIYSPLLHGDAVMNRVKTDFYTKERMRVPKEDWVVRRDVIPPILERGYHDYLLSLIKERAKPQDAEKKYAKSIWTGKLICQSCGCHYYGRRIKDKNGGIYRRFRCGNRFRGGSCDNRIVGEEELEKAVGKCFEEKLGAEIAAWEKSLKKELRRLLERGKPGERKEYNIKIKGCSEDEMEKMQLERLLDLYISGAVTKEEFLSCKNRISCKTMKNTEKKRNISEWGNTGENKEDWKVVRRKAEAEEELEDEREGIRNRKSPEEIIKITEESGLFGKAVLQFLIRHIIRAEVSKDGKILIYLPIELVSGGKEENCDNFFLTEADLSFNQKENVV